MRRPSKVFIGITAGAIAVLATTSSNAEDTYPPALNQIIGSHLDSQLDSSLLKYKRSIIFSQVSQNNYPVNDTERSGLLISRRDTACPAQVQRILTAGDWFPALSTSKSSNSQENYLAGIMPNNFIYIWTLASAHRLGTIPGNQQEVPPKSQITSIALTSDGRLLASGLSQGQIILWNTLNRMKEVKIPQLELSGKVRSVSFDSNNQYLAAVYGAGKKAIVYDIPRILNNKQQIEEFETINQLTQNKDYYELADETLTNKDPKIKTIADSVYVQSVSFSPNDKLIATSGSDQNFKLWDKSTWKRIKTYPLPGSYQGALQLVFSPDSQVLATALAVNSVGEVRLWDVKDPSNVRLLNTFSGFTDNVRSVAFSPNGQYLLAGSLDGSIKVWDWKANKVIFQQCGDTSGIGSVVFDPVSNNSFISQGLDGAIKFWTIPPTQPPYQVGKIILGILLLLYSLIALYLIYTSRQKLTSVLCKILDKLNQLIVNGKSLEKSISGSTELIDDFGENIKKTSDDLNLLDTKVQCIEYNDENTSIKVDLDIAPIVKDIREASDSVYKLKAQNEDLQAGITKLIGDFEDDIPQEKQILQIFNPLYVVLMLLHLGLFSLGLWILTSSLSGSSSTPENQAGSPIANYFPSEHPAGNQVTSKPTRS